MAARQRPLFAVVAAFPFLLPAPSCRTAPPGPGQVRDLLADAEFAEVASDNLDLDLLMAQATLLHDGVEAHAPPLKATSVDQVTLQLPFSTAGEKEMLLAARSNLRPPDGFGLAVSLNGHPLGRVHLTEKTGEFRLALPSRFQNPGLNEVRLAVRRGHGGFELSRLETRAPGAEGSVPSALPEPGGLWVPAGSKRRFHLLLDGASELVLAAQGTAAAQLTVSVVGENGSTLLARENGARIRKRLKIPAPKGAFIRVDLECGGKGGVRIQRLLLVSKQAGVQVQSRKAPAPPERRNVIIFLSDTLRADHLGAYGYGAPTSPRFDAFAREGLLFDDAQAVSSWTRPTVASLFTGLGVVTHGVGGPRHPLAIGLNTMAEAFRASGYRTAAVVANPVVPESFSRGFDTWEGESMRDHPAADATAKALDWIEAGQEPFFLYVHVLEPHAPYQPKKGHWIPFRSPGYRGDPDPVAVLSRARREGGLPSAELAFLISAYDAEIHEMDAAFGQLLDGLRERRLLERSLVIFTADHGEEFFDHGGEGHGSTLYNEVLKTPLAMRIPGLAGGRATPLSVDQADLAPTLLALAGLEPPKEMRGRNLSSFLGGDEVPDEEPIRLAHLHYGEKPTDPNLYSARAFSLKLIVHREAGRSAASRLELYDLANDPGEKKNLAADRPLAAGYLFARLEAMRAVQEGRRERRGAGGEIEQPEAEEALRALGYIR